MLRLETFFCKLSMTKIKLSFKEMRQKFLKKVISPHVSQIFRNNKVTVLKSTCEVGKNTIVYQNLYHYLIPKFLFKSQIWSQEVRRAIHISMGACKLKSLNYRKNIAQKEMENLRKYILFPRSSKCNIHTQCIVLPWWRKYSISTVNLMNIY